MQKKSKDILKSNLPQILDNLIQVGWTSYHWQIFYESINDKDTISYFYLLIEWLLGREKNILPKSSYLLNELIIYLVESKKEIELEYIVEKIELDKNAYSSLFFALDNRINQKNKMLDIVQTIKKSSFLGISNAVYWSICCLFCNNFTSWSTLRKLTPIESELTS